MNTFFCLEENVKTSSIAVLILFILGCGNTEPEVVAPAPHLPVPAVILWDSDRGIVVWDIAPWPRTDTQWVIGDLIAYRSRDKSRKWMAYAPGGGVPAQTGFDSWQEAASWLAAWHYDQAKGMIDESVQNSVAALDRVP